MHIASRRCRQEGRAVDHRRRRDLRANLIGSGRHSSRRGRASRRRGFPRVLSRRRSRLQPDTRSAARIPLNKRADMGRRSRPPFALLGADSATIYATFTLGGPTRAPRRGAEHRAMYSGTLRAGRTAASSRAASRDRISLAAGHSSALGRRAARGADEARRQAREPGAIPSLRWVRDEEVLMTRPLVARLRLRLVGSRPFRAHRAWRGARRLQAVTCLLPARSIRPCAGSGGRAARSDHTLPRYPLRRGARRSPGSSSGCVGRLEERVERTATREDSSARGSRPRVVERAVSRRAVQETRA